MRGEAVWRRHWDDSPLHGPNAASSVIRSLFLRCLIRLGVSSLSASVYEQTCMRILWRRQHLQADRMAIIQSARVVVRGLVRPVESEQIGFLVVTDTSTRNSR